MTRRDMNGVIGLILGLGSPKIRLVFEIRYSI